MDQISLILIVRDSATKTLFCLESLINSIDNVLIVDQNIINIETREMFVQWGQDNNIIVKFYNEPINISNLDDITNVCQKALDIARIAFMNTNYFMYLFEPLVINCDFDKTTLMEEKYHIKDIFSDKSFPILFKAASNWKVHAPCPTGINTKQTIGRKDKVNVIGYTIIN